MTEKLKTANTVIPALPGFDIVTLDFDPPGFDYFPVVSWIISTLERDGDVTGGDTFVIPVCANHNLNGFTEIIRYPNGSIVIAGEKKFEKGMELEALDYAVKKFAPRLGVVEVSSLDSQASRTRG